MRREGKGPRSLRTFTAVLASALLTAGLSVAAVTATSTPAVADTQPIDPTLPETVSAAALPTVQIDGVVWAQVIVGNRVYATGEFAQARPAGAPEGVNTTPRSNIIAYDLTTGVMIDSWAPTLNAQGLAIVASPDGSTIFVAGMFTQVNGQTRNRLAALDAQTGALLSWNPGANARVDALAVTQNTVYFGGDFTNVGTNQAGFSARSRLAAADLTSGAIQPWAPTADYRVNAIVYHEASGRVIIGGQFDTLNGVTQLGMGSLDGVTGDLRPWAANTVIKNHGTDAAISALTTDGEQVFGVGWAYFGGGATANFEGAFGADPWTGALNWVDGGRGDNYDLAVAGNVLYTVGHPHDWGMVGFNPQYNPTYQFQRTIAINKYRSPTLTNAYGPDPRWAPFAGQSAAQPLHWLPTLTGGTYTGRGQAAWSVATNGDYVVEGGEFPRVNGTPQQGLVRFAKRTISPTVDQVQGYAELTPALTAAGPGSVRVGWTAAWDRDNELLKVEVLRGATTATSTVLKTTTTRATWWNRPPLAFIDTTASPGSTQTYRIRVTDPFGNGIVGPSASVTIPAGTPPTSPYAASVAVDTPEWQWRLDEASGTTAFDRAGSNDLTLGITNNRNVAGALLNEINAATNFPGTSSTSPAQGASQYWQDGPQVFSLETWIRTATTNGGQILGFGDGATARSDTDGSDRTLYMNNSGQIYFGVRPDMGTRTTINSPGTYRDNQWHHIVASLGSDGMKLYVDGNLVAQNVNVKKAQVYRGYWRVGSDRLTSWPSTPTREAITANIDEVAVYSKALTIGHVRAHYLASGRTTVFPNILPVASFSSSPHYLTPSFDGTGSSDDDGTIASYAWDFGDNTTGTGATPQHTYANPGTYTVTLSVTDNRGGTASVTGSVTVTNPPANIPPVASFTSNVSYRTATLTSTSTDEDGTIATAAWDFGDGTTGTGLSVQKTYAAAGTYPVTLTVTDDRGETAVATGSVTVTNFYATDSFGRTVANGLGTADNGGAWTTSGAASSFAVAGDAGRITGAVGANRAAYLTAVRQTQNDLRTSVSVDVPSTGSGIYTSLIGRRISAGNEYRLKLRLMADKSVNAYLVRLVGNVETVLGNVTVPGLQANPGDTLRTRFLVTGTSSTTLRAKIWRKGVMEPQAWSVSATDNSPGVLQGAGDVGFLLYVSGSWTGALPVLSIDDVKVGPDGGAPVNTPPTASFTSNSEYRKVWFDGGASSDADDDGSVVAYNWNFGDGTTGTGVSPTHTYATAGSYNVTLTVTDNGGVTGSLTQAIQVQNPPPPIAFFETSYTFLSADFDASGSSDVDGTIASYFWNFGDGTMGSGITAHHVYSEAGTYTVTLNVVDNEGNVGTGSETLVLDPAPPPSAAFTSSTFFQSASFDGTGSSTPNGSITSYSWNFGDGTFGTGPTPTHTYANAGTYHVSLTITDSVGGTDTLTSDVTVGTAPLPTASFTATPTYLNVTFDASASSATSGASLVDYQWDYGDGTSGSGVTPNHTYTSASTYTVTLTVTDSFGGTDSHAADVAVTAAPLPTASFTATPTFLNVAFDATGSSAIPGGSITSYSWDFGDASTGAGPTPSHTYAGANTYMVTLTVTDSFAGTASMTLPVSVVDPPVKYATDTFTRSVTNGLGTAEVGGPYTLSGAASNFAVTGGQGRMVGGAGATRAAYLNGVSRTEIDFVADVSLDRTSNGGGAYVSLIGRQVANGTDYRVKLRYMANGTVIAYLVRNVAGVETVLGNVTVPSLNVVGGDVLRVRFVLTGTSTTTVRAKVWRASSSEPATWLVTANDNAPVALRGPGAVGVMHYVSGSWIGTAPTLAFDNLDVGPPA